MSIKLRLRRGLLRLHPAGKARLASPGLPRLLYREGSRNDGDVGLSLRPPRELFERQIVE